MTGKPKKSNPPKLTWEVPPSREASSSIYVGVIKQLRETPGRWARIRTVANQSTAYTSRKSFMRAVDGDDHWEAVVRPIGDGPEYGLWARLRTDAQMQEQAP
jgi:hypothetical protein